MCSKKNCLNMIKRIKKGAISTLEQRIYIYPSSNKFNGYLIKSQKFEF